MSYVPALPDVTRYTWWGDVPEGLSTKTDLDGRGLKPGSPPVGQVLYHGNCYAPLYEDTQAVAKRPCSPAQRAVLDRARTLQYECRRCGARRNRPLGRGRWCEPCGHAVALFAVHARAQERARQLLADEDAVLLVVAADPAAPAEKGPDSVAVLGIRDRRTLYAAEAGQDATAQRAAVLDDLDALLAERTVVHESHETPATRYPSRLLQTAGQHLLTVEMGEAHPWATGRSRAGRVVGTLWAEWFAWTSHPTSYYPGTPWESTGIALPWHRSTAAEDDARGLAALLQQIADGSTPAWPGALWVADRKGEPDLSDPRVRKAAEAMVIA
ncbi:hypothetical protein ACT1U9_32895 (plasmid) [Streptomyces sp. BR1]|uniref:hypothetical protein n=1 Tax=Streptomyces sp. BR1 TaxID=1592323 RepID=UPI00402B4696